MFETRFESNSKARRFAAKAPNKTKSLTSFPRHSYCDPILEENFLTAFGSGQPAVCSGSRCLGGPLRGEREHFALIALARLIS